MKSKNLHAPKQSWPAVLRTIRKASYRMSSEAGEARAKGRLGSSHLATTQNKTPV